MSLNIEDPEAQQLAQAIAETPGETMHTSAGKASIEELLAIAQRAAANVKRPYLDHAELLYDEHGLPR
jgi:antitoxin VapB